MALNREHEGDNQHVEPDQEPRFSNDFQSKVEAKLGINDEKKLPIT